MGGLARTWYVMVLSVCAVVTVPAPMRTYPSSTRRKRDFSSEGMSLLMSLWKMEGDLGFSWEKWETEGLFDFLCRLTAISFL